LLLAAVKRADGIKSGPLAMGVKSAKNPLDCLRSSRNGGETIVDSATSD
jgi:hypothetical protein